MQRAQRVTMVLLACSVALTSLIGCDPASGNNPRSTPEPTIAATAVPLVVPPALPTAEPTIEPPLPGITPTWPEPTTTPTPAVLQAATMITPSIVSTITLGLDVGLAVEGSVNSPEPVISMAWAPTGDSLLYVTTSGKLYSYDLEGKSPTLLHTYERGSVWNIFEEQVSLGSTMYLVHFGKDELDRRLPSHVDELKFAPDQPPTVTESRELPIMRGISWWKPDRASAVLGTNYVGGERLVTVNAEGHVIEERNIPYMSSAAVRPGGEWLAYSTSQQFTSTPLYNSDPSTGYLLNLTTGRRLQLTPSQTGGVGGWSPDGRWLFVGTYNGYHTLVDIDLKEGITLPSGLASEGSWSPDSKQIAIANLLEQGDGHIITGWTGNLTIIDIPTRKMAKFDYDSSDLKTLGVLSEAKWSPDGKMLALLTRDRNQDGQNSRLTPAIYLMSVK